MGNEENLKTVDLLGFKINAISMKEAVDYAFELITSRKGGQVVTINPEMIQCAEHNNDFRQIIENADLVLPDGVGIKLGLQLKKINIHRIAGIEFAYNMLKKCAKENIPVAFVGAKPHIISSAVKNLEEEIEDLKIVYYHNGYFSDEERVTKELRKSSPRLVLVALGSPRQEMFIKNAREEMTDALMIGVGGSFDVWSGQVKRAPKFYQAIGMEWLYRTVKEPSRFKRIFPTLPKFMIRVLKEEVIKK